MKKLFFLVPFLATVLLSFKFSYDVRKNTCEAAKIKGLYVFIDAEPVAPYDKIGEVSGAGLGAAMNPQYEVVRNAMIAKAKDKFKDGEGVILYLNSGGKDRADVIKFK